jgi:hypothetical protein
VQITSATWGVTESGKSLELSTGTAPDFGPLNFVTNALTQYDSTVYAPLPPSPPNLGTPGALGPVSVSGSPTLLITEIMANPAGDETGQEWFEIYNATGGAIDLNGYTVSTATQSFTISGSPHIIPAGGLFIVARTDDPALNGGLPRVDYAWGQALNLVNSNGELVLGAPGGAMVTRVTWTSTSDGVSQELTGGIFPNFTQVNFTPATTSYTPISPPPSLVSLNFGTPDLPNIAGFNVIGIPPVAPAVPLPAAAWLFGSAMFASLALARRTKRAA